MDFGVVKLLLIVAFLHAAICKVVVDHPVLFKMPALQSDKAAEAKVLKSVDSLRTFPGVITLFIGPLLKDADGYTHGLFARFPDQKTLLSYYNSAQFLSAVQPQIPYIRGERTVDFNTVVNVDPAENFANEIIHMAMFTFRSGINQTVIRSVLGSLGSLSSSLPSIVRQITYGANNYDRDRVYSHAFVARLASENATAEFYRSSGYATVIEKTLKPLCSNYMETDVRPIPATTRSLSLH